jgi:hypothetical protein
MGVSVGEEADVREAVAEGFEEEMLVIGLGKRGGSGCTVWEEGNCF